MCKFKDDFQLKLSQNNINQYEVAKAIGVSECTVIRWLRYEPSKEKKALLETTLNKLIKEKKRN